MNANKIEIVYVPVEALKHPDYNPRTRDPETTRQLAESIRRHGFVNPILANRASGRENIVIGGNYRLDVAREIGMREVPVVYVDVSDIAKEREICLRLNKNVGGWNLEMLADFGEEILKDVGFTSEELDEIFSIPDSPEVFDLQRELDKLSIHEIAMRKGQIWGLGEHRLMIGDSTVESDVLKLMSNEQADMCCTDPPYLLDYLNGKKKHGNATEGFGLKRDRRYLETDELPPDFTDLWMANIAKIQKPDFSIIVFENPKNLKTIWEALEKRWRYRNTITWHVPNRVQGFSAKYRFFNKTDIAIVGTGGDVTPNLAPEDEKLLENEYENAIFATSGKPHWESYEKGKKICPTDFVSHVAADEKSSGQGVIFGTKPVESSSSPISRSSRNAAMP